MEKSEPCYADRWGVNCHRPLLRSVCCILKLLKNRATEHTALPLMGVYLGKTKKIDKTQAPQSLGLLCLEMPRFGYNLHVLGRKKWIKKMWYLCTMEYYSAIKSMK